MNENRITLTGTMFSVGIPPRVQRKMGGERRGGEGRGGKGGEGKGGEERGGEGKGGRGGEGGEGRGGEGRGGEGGEGRDGRGGEEGIMVRNRAVVWLGEWEIEGERCSEHTRMVFVYFLTAA